MNRRGFFKRFFTASLGLGFLYPACKKKNSPTQPGDSGNGSTTDKEILCACHGSVFDIRGNVRSGPATQPLSTVPAVLNGNQIVLGDNALVVDLTLAENQALLAVQGVKKFAVQGRSNPIIVVRISSSEVIALDSTCTHQGCEVNLPA